MNQDELAQYLESGISPDVSASKRGRRAADQGGNEGAARLRGLLRDEATWFQPDPRRADALLAAIQDELRPRELPAVPEADVSPPEVPAPVRRRGRFVVLSLAAAALVLLAGVAGVVLLARQDDDVPTQEFAMTGTDLAPEASATATAEERPSGFAMTLDISDLPPAEPGTYYQGWVKSPDDELVTIGTFHMWNGEDDVELWAGVDVEGYPTVTVTLQEEGAGAESSGQVVLSGEIPDP